MTRPIGLLMIATLSVVSCAGCAQLGLDKDGGDRTFRAPRVAQNTNGGFSTSTEGQLVDVPTSKKVSPQAEPRKISSNLILPPPPTDQKKLPAPPPEVKPPPQALATHLPTHLPSPNQFEDPGPSLLPIPPPGPIVPLSYDVETIGQPLKPMVEALKCFVDDRDKEALEHLKKYDAATQELLLRWLPPLALLARKKLPDMGPTEIGAIDEQVRGGLALVRQRMDLTIEKAVFCEWVKSFGNYQPVQEGHLFLASAPNRPGERAQLYVEVKNFANDKRDSFYETRFASAVEIHDSKGDRIWFYRFEDREKPIRTRTPLNDCFNHYSFFVPHLPPGTYSLTIQITDETVPERRRETRKSLEFRVGSGVR